jgi:putative NADPH-quinone reductase
VNEWLDELLQAEVAHQSQDDRGRPQTLSKGDRIRVSQCWGERKLAGREYGSEHRGEVEVRHRKGIPYENRPS